VVIAPLHRGKIIAKATARATLQSKVGIMNAHHPPSVPEGGHPDMDYAEHEATYKLFLQIAKFTVLGVVALLAVMALTLT
jgi:hypothetical protein